MNTKWKIINKSFVYQSKNHEDEISIRNDLVKPPNGNAFNYIYVDCPYEVVFCLGIDKEMRALMINQYRILVDEWLWEIPAGSPQKGESLEDAARREFEEESGYIAGDISFLCSFFPSVGITNQKCHVYLATNLQKGIQSLGVGEQISNVSFFDRPTLELMIREGKIRNSGALIGVMNYLHIQQLKISTISPPTVSALPTCD